MSPPGRVVACAPARPPEATTSWWAQSPTRGLTDYAAAASQAFARVRLHPPASPLEDDLQGQLEVQSRECHSHFLDGEGERFRDVELRVRELNRRAHMLHHHAGGTAGRPRGNNGGARRASGTATDGGAGKLEFAALGDSSGTEGGDEVNASWMVDLGGNHSNDLFVSHCWRSQGTQELKRRLISELSRISEGGMPGMTYWADFLDLYAEGPMPWRDEVEEAIKGSAKFVAFVDFHYVMSYNCLMELAIALRHNKPIVPVIIENQAWTLLTNPVGAEVAWHDSSDLRSHEGGTMGGQMPPFGVRELQRLFHALGSINFCPCRPIDFINLGDRNVTRGFLSAVRKDILYLKEHTELSRRALKWDIRKRRHLLLQGEEVSDWVKWCSQAEKYRHDPAPTDLQKQYVQKSKAHKSGRRTFLTILTIIVGLMVLSGAATSVVMAIRADKAKQTAEDAAANALAQEKIAIAEKQSVLVWNLLYKGEEMKAVDSYLTLKLLRRAMQLLPSTNSKPLEAAAVALFRSVLGPVGQRVPCIGKLYSADPSTDSIHWDPSGRMLAVDELNDVLVWDVSGANTRSWRLTGHSSVVSAIGWADEGLVLASGEASGEILLWQMDDVAGEWSTFQTLKGHSKRIQFLFFAPGSKAVLCSCSLDQTVRIWRGLDSGTVTVQVMQASSIADTGVWRPDGLVVAVKSRADTVDFFDVSSSSETPAKVVTLEDSSLIIKGVPAYSQDGTQISLPLLNQETVIINLTSGAELRVPALPGSASSSRSSVFWLPPDPGTLLGGGHLILQTKSNMDVWVGRQIHGGRWSGSVDITTHINSVVHLSVSPDGQHLATTSKDGSVHMCDLRNITAGCLERTYGASGPLAVGWTGTGFRYITKNGDLDPDGLTAPGGGRRLLQRGSPQSSTPVEFAVEWAVDGVSTGLPLEPPVSAHNRHGMSADGSMFAYSVQNEDGGVGVVRLGTNGTHTEIRLRDGQDVGEFRRLVFSPGNEMLVGSYPATDGPCFSIFNLTSEASAFTKLDESSVMITDMQWAPTGLTFAITSSDPAVRIYSLLQDGSPVLEQLISWGLGACMAWSPDGRDIAIAKGGIIELWMDPRSGAGDFREIHIAANNRVSAIVYTPDGLSLVYGQEGGEVRLLHLNGAPDKSLLLRGHDSQIQEMALASGHRNLVASAGVLGTIRVWDANTAPRAGIKDLQGHVSSVFTVAFSPEGGLLASASKDGTLRVWNHSSTQQTLWDVTVGPNQGSWILSVAWAGDSQDSGPWGIATGCEDGSVWVHVFRGTDQVETRQVTRHTGKLTSVQWWSMDKPVLSASHDNTLMLWKPMEIDSTPVLLTGHAGPVSAASYHPWGDYLASGSADGSVRIWLLIEEISLYGRTVQEIFEHRGPVMAVSYSPDGHQLVTTSNDGEVRLYSTPAGGYATFKQLIVSHKAPVASVAFAPDSRSLVFGSWDGAVYLHQLAENNSIALQGTQGLVGQIAFSPNGKWVVAASDGSSYNHLRGPLTLWDVGDREDIQVHVLEGHAVNRLASVAFSPCSGWIAFGTTDDNVRVAELVDSQVDLARLNEIMFGDLDLTLEELLEVGLPTQVLDPVS